MKPPRVLIAILGLDQHETGALAVSALLRDAGAEVVYLGRFATPESIAAAAFDESVDVVGVSAHSWEYLHYVDEVLARLEKNGARIPFVIGGAVLTPSDRKTLLAKGVAAVFGADATRDEIVQSIWRLAGRAPADTLARPGGAASETASSR
jgi:methylmalonyl-CoA mutase C-terminal domain/subunit